MSDYKQILSNIAKSLVDNPDDVAVIILDEDEDNISLELTVAPDDMGKVIGKHGKIAKAIRTVMKAVANANGQRISIDIR